MKVDDTSGNGGWEQCPATRLRNATRARGQNASRPTPVTPYPFPCQPGAGKGETLTRLRVGNWRRYAESCTHARHSKPLSRASGEGLG